MFLINYPDLLIKMLLHAVKWPVVVEVAERHTWVKDILPEYDEYFTLVKSPVRILLNPHAALGEVKMTLTLIK